MPEGSRQTYFDVMWIMRTCAFWWMNSATSSTRVRIGKSSFFFLLHWFHWNTECETGPSSVRSPKWKTGIYFTWWEMETMMWVVDAFMAYLWQRSSLMHFTFTKYDWNSIFEFHSMQQQEYFNSLWKCFTIHGICDDCDDSIISLGMIHVSTVIHCRSTALNS